MSTPSLKTCNLDYLFELAKGDMAFVREMVQVFLEENGNELYALETAIQAGDHEQIRQVAHKLRSSIPYVGLDLVIGDEVADVEEFARTNSDLQAIKDLFSKIKQVSQEAVKELSGLTI